MSCNISAKSLINASIYGGITVAVGIALHFIAKQLFPKEHLSSVRNHALFLFALGVVIYALAAFLRSSTGSMNMYQPSPRM